MSVKKILKRILPPGLRQRIREYGTSLNVTHLFGPKRIPLSQHDVVVTCVVKNGEFYIKSFIKHYSQKGFRHIFFLDNGSSDQTISIAKKCDNLSVCQSTLSIDRYQEFFKQHLALNSVEGGWCLDADIDEFFDYPFSDAISLHDLLKYLNGKKYAAVMTQLLDMFSCKPLSQLTKHRNDNLQADYEYYDISNLTKTKYQASELVARYGSRNQISNADAALFFGGIRRTLFGNNCLLTKHSLFMPGKELDLFPHVHFVNGARLADISCVMLHYKLTNNALEATLQNKEGFVGLSKRYEQFRDFLVNNPTYQIKQHSSVEFGNIDELVKSGFLFVSQEYRDYVRMISSRA